MRELPPKPGSSALANALKAAKAAEKAGDVRFGEDPEGAGQLPVVPTYATYRAASDAHLNIRNPNLDRTK